MDLNDLYVKLKENYDIGDWWPASSKFEIMTGAVLVQQTNWHNVEKVIISLKERDLMSVNGLASIDVSDLEKLVRPAGFFRQKSRRIRGLAIYLEENYGGDPDRLFDLGTEELREELLSLEGTG